MSLIADRVDNIKKNIAGAALKSGRAPDDITLIGVTKTIDTSRMAELVELGVKHLGENKVQELLDKYDAFSKDTVWHMIGHLQTNKVKYIIDKVSLIHSVDSLKLAEEINKRANNIDVVMEILVEVNIAEEESKHGIVVSEVHGMMEKLRHLPNISVCGLMTVAPFVENQEENRLFFRKMNQLFIDIGENFNNNIDMKFLSMGMTNDYEVAIEEGANMVRIGTGIFGSRNYHTL